jgi:hypothetical protein
MEGLTKIMNFCMSCSGKMHNYLIVAVKMQRLSIPSKLAARIAFAVNDSAAEPKVSLEV